MSNDPSAGYPVKTRWQELGDEFHMMIGYCIAAWADVDDALFQIFSDCVGPRDQCAIVYFKTPGLEGRFTMTDEIVRSVLPKKKPGEHDHADVQRWNRAKEGYDKLLATRRRIAHHPVTIRANIPTFNSMPFGRHPIGWLPALISGYEIYMSSNEKLRGKSADLPALKISDLRKHQEDVGMLGDRLTRFLLDVLTRPSL